MDSASTSGRHLLILFLLPLLVYNLNLRVIYRSSDTLPAEYLPYSIITKGDLDLNEFTSLYSNKTLTPDYPPKLVSEVRGRPLYRLHYSMGLIDGTYIPLYPVGSAILSVPFYLPALLLDIPPDSWLIPYLAKFSVSFFCAISVVLLYLAISELHDRKTAFHISLAYAFATHTFSVSSQDLWQHAATQMLLALTLMLLIKGLKDKRFVTYSGVSLSLAVFIRPTNIIFASVFTLYVLQRHREILMRFILHMTPITTLFFTYNLYYFNNLLGGYVFVSEFETGVFNFLHPLNPLGLFGVLLSTNRGILIYSPFLVYALWGIREGWRKNILFKYVTFSCIAYVYLISTLNDWGGGRSFGYRLLSDILPFAVFFIAGVYEKIRTDAGHRVVFTILITASLLIQLIGFMLYDASDPPHHPITTLQQSQLYYYLYDIKPVLCTPDWISRNIHCEKKSLFNREIQGRMRQPTSCNSIPPRSFVLCLSRCLVCWLWVFSSLGRV